MTRKTIIAGAFGLGIFASQAVAAPDVAPPLPLQIAQGLEKDLDLKDFQALGVVAGLAQETGNFRFVQEISPSSAISGAGWAQWSGAKRDAFEAKAADLGAKSLTSYQLNYSFLVDDLQYNEPDVLERVRQTTTLEEATATFVEGYLQPLDLEAAVDTASRYANAYAGGDFSGVGCQTLHNITLDGSTMNVCILSPDMALHNNETIRLLGEMAERVTLGNPIDTSAVELANAQGRVKSAEYNVEMLRENVEQLEQLQAEIEADDPMMSPMQ